MIVAGLIRLESYKPVPVGPRRGNAVRAPALPAHTSSGGGSEGAVEAPFDDHPNTSSVMVRNHASASTASAARVARGAPAGLTPPEPGTSASCPPAEGW